MHSTVACTKSYVFWWFLMTGSKLTWIYPQICCQGLIAKFDITQIWGRNGQLTNWWPHAPPYFSTEHRVPLQGLVPPDSFVCCMHCTCLYNSYLLFTYDSSLTAHTAHHYSHCNVACDSMSPRLHWKSLSCKPIQMQNLPKKSRHRAAWPAELFICMRKETAWLSILNWNLVPNKYGLNTFRANIMAINSCSLAQ